MRRFRLVVVEGPRVGVKIESSGDRCSIGSHESNDVVLDDATVSRFHCEVRIEDGTPVIADLGSRNGTVVDGVRVKAAYLKNGSLLALGRCTLRFDLEASSNQLPLSDRTKLGDLVGGSLAMRTVYAMLERAATSDITVLIEGETGTGKSLAAYEIHRNGKRGAGPFVTLDCGAIPANLLESELFGHEKGSFTGADARRVGAFEEAHGGTIFLDEIGELPLDLQIKLLRVVETRELRRVGGNKSTTVDVRLIAATNRDLRQEVNEGRFRSDLYFRLAVVRIRMPALRERAGDIGEIVEQLGRSLGASASDLAALFEPEARAALERSAWPGNIRELRNYVQQCLFFGRAVPPEDGSPPAERAARPVDVDLQYGEARQRATLEFERAYVERLLEKHGGNVAEAADAAGIHRVSLHRLVREHGLGHLTKRR